MHLDRAFRIVLTVQFLTLGCNHAETQDAQNLGKAQMDALVGHLNGNTVTVEIFEISATKLFRVRVNPQHLEEWWDRKVTARWKEESEVARISSILRTTSVHLEPLPSDLRSGVIFYSSTDEKRIGALYFDRTGRRGAINEIPVSFVGLSFAELRKMLLQPLE
jgi:hypothetical protein